MYNNQNENSESVFTSIFNNQAHSTADLINFASALPNIIWIADAKGSMQFCNDFGLEYLGFEHSNITDEEWALTVHPTEIKSIAEIWKQALNQKIPFSNIQRQRNKHNEYEWFKVSANPVFDKKGEIVNWIGISINIDEEIRASQELKSTNNRLDLSIRNSKSGIWDWNLQKDIIVYNDNWWEMLGYKKGEIEENTTIWERLLHKDDKTKALKNLNDHLQGKTDFYESVYRLKTKSNKWLWIYDSGRVIDRNEDGEPMRFIGLQQDFTTRKFQEEIIKKSEVNMRTLAQSSQKLMELTTMDEIREHCVETIYKYIGERGIVTYTSYEKNNTVWRVLKTKGYSSLIKKITKIIGRPIEGLSGPNDLESLKTMSSGKLVKFQPNMTKLFKGILNEKLVSSIMKLLNFDKFYSIGIVKGESVHGNISIILQDDGVEMDSNFIETLLYQTASALERKEIEEKIILQNAELIELNKEMDVVIKGLSHDLKAPINTAKGILELNKYDKNELSPEMLENVYKSLDRLDGITDDLLGMVFNNRAIIEKTSINLKSFVEHIIAEQESEPGFEEINWSININQNTNKSLDSKRIKLILRNLISNSIKYRDPKKKTQIIEVSAQSKKAHINISVKDNGIGMSSDQLEKVFDMFYRADYSKRGIGLGLHIIKQTVQKLDGSIEINSKFKEGTEISFTIPNKDNL